MIHFAAPTDLLDTAARLAAEAHAGQTRKGDGSPYIAHPFMVALILARHGFPEPVLAAALVHDVLEDTATPASVIEARLGAQVLKLVAAVTNEELPDWEEKKRRYVARVGRAPEGAKAVCAADKMHNLRCLMQAYAQEGPAVWKRFNRGRAGKLGFEREVLAMLRRTWDHPIVEEYAGLLAEFERAVPE